MTLTSTTRRVQPENTRPSREEATPPPLGFTIRRPLWDGDPLLAQARGIVAAYSDERVRDLAATFVVNYHLPARRSTVSREEYELLTSTDIIRQRRGLEHFTYWVMYYRKHGGRPDREDPQASQPAPAQPVVTVAPAAPVLVEDKPKTVPNEPGRPHPGMMPSRPVVRSGSTGSALRITAARLAKHRRGGTASKLTHQPLAGGLQRDAA